MGKALVHINTRCSTIVVHIIFTSLEWFFKGVEHYFIRVTINYNYHSSLSFVYIYHEPTPKLWDPGKNLFLMENKPVAVLFEGRKAHMMADMDQEKAKWYVSSKLNLDPSGIRTASDGLSIAKGLGLLQRYPSPRISTSCVKNLLRIYLISIL
jgi:hypothetical protein